MDGFRWGDAEVVGEPSTPTPGLFYRCTDARADFYRGWGFLMLPGEVHGPPAPMPGYTPVA